MFGIFKKKILPFHINPEKKIVYVKLQGEVTTDQIVNVTKTAIKDTRHTPDTNWILDSRKSKQLFSSNNINSLGNFYKNNSTSFKNVKMAVIIDSPKQSISVDALARHFECNNVEISVKKVIDKETAENWIAGKI